VTRTGQRTMARVWGVPRNRQAGLAGKLVRGLGGLLIIGVAFLATAFASSFVTATGRDFGERVGVLVVLVLANAGFYLLSFMVLAPPATVSWRPLVPGSVVARAGFTL